MLRRDPDSRDESAESDRNRPADPAVGPLNEHRAIFQFRRGVGGLSRGRGAVSHGSRAQRPAAAAAGSPNQLNTNDSQDQQAGPILVYD